LGLGVEDSAGRVVAGGGPTVSLTASRGTARRRTRQRVYTASATATGEGRRRGPAARATSEGRRLEGRTGCHLAGASPRWSWPTDAAARRGRWGCGRVRMGRLRAGWGGSVAGMSCAG